MDELKVLGQNLSRFRKKNNLSYQAVADAIGISAAHVCRIENGTAKPSFDVLINISRLMGVPLYYLFLDSGETTDFAEFAKAAQEQLTQLGWNSERLAHETGINLFRLLDILSGKNHPTSAEVAVLSEKLEITMPRLPVNQRLSLIEKALIDLGLDRDQIRNITEYVRNVMKSD